MKRVIGGVVVGRLAGAVFQAVTFILVARAVPVAEFGVFAVVVTIAALATTVSDFGMTNIASRSVAQGRPDRAGMAVGAATLGTLGLMGAALIALVAVATAQQPALMWLPLFIIGTAVDKLAETYLGVLVARRESLWTTVSLLARRSVPFFVVFIWPDAPEMLIVFASGYLAGGLAAVLICAPRVTTTLGRLPRPAYRGGLGHEGWHFTVTALAAQARTLDQVFVGAVSGTIAAAFYGAANRIVSPLYVFAQALSGIALPHAVGRKRGILSRIVWVAMAAAVGVSASAVLLAPIAEQVMIAVLGPSYAGAGPVLTAMVAAAPWIALSSPVAAMLQGQGLDRSVTTASLATAALTLIALFVVAPAGPAWVAAAMGACSAVRLAWMAVVLGRPQNLG